MERRGVGFGWVVVVVGALVAGAAQAQAPRLRVKKVFDRWAADHTSRLMALGDSGVAVGNVNINATGARLPATFDGNGYQVLPIPSDSTAGWALGIDDLGRVVGQSALARAGLGERPGPHPPHAVGLPLQ